MSVKDQDQHFTFDKFMDDIVVRETKRKKSNEIEETPQRKYVRRYTEKAGNRTVIRGK